MIIEFFIPQLEAALISFKVPREEWKQYFHSQITVEPKEKVMNVLTDEDATYEDINTGLLGTATMSFVNSLFLFTEEQKTPSVLVEEEGDMQGGEQTTGNEWK